VRRGLNPAASMHGGKNKERWDGFSCNYDLQDCTQTESNRIFNLPARLCAVKEEIQIQKRASNL